MPPPDPLTSIHQGESFFSTFQPQSNSFSGTANQQNTDLLPKPHSATQNQSNIVNNVQNGNKTMLGSQCHSGAANSTQNTLRPALKANAKGPENRLTPNNSDPNKKTEGKKAEFDKLKFEGMVVKVEKGVSGYYCVFCETFAADLVTAKMHVESPKHQRVSFLFFRSDTFFISTNSNCFYLRLKLETSSKELMPNLPLSLTESVSI